MNSQMATVGLDLGTSAVKVLKRYGDGRTVKAREPYAGPLPGGWWEAARRALCRVGLGDVMAIGLASQVGTYVVDGEHVVSWDSPAGSGEIDEVLALLDGPEWDREIAMRHPRILSYPLPRLLYIQRHWPDAREVCQPKDWLLRKLTGEYATDPWSWRGLCKPPEGGYSQRLLDLAGLDGALLPPIISPTAPAGRTLPAACEAGEIPGGIPVYTGMNDFFASLLGMGMDAGQIFDITGTSEHLGVIEAEYRPDGSMVNGPWLRGYAHYGVTASSGPSLALGGRLDKVAFDCPDIDAAGALLEDMRRRRPPVFLPYLNGERAPIWNADARGCYFGLSGGCDVRDLAYSALEGVCFSLLHVYEALGRPPAAGLRLSGGASGNPLLNLMKAELFDLPVQAAAEADTTALGAAMAAMVGLGLYGDWREAVADQCRAAGRVEPAGRWRGWLLERYGIYRRLYPALETTMAEWRNIP